jgi:hypothetical protein
MAADRNGEETSAGTLIALMIESYSKNIWEVIRGIRALRKSKKE